MRCFEQHYKCVLLTGSEPIVTRQGRGSSGGLSLVVREDCELLTELARLNRNPNRNMASLCIRVKDGTSNAAEQ
jgi:hypothetical protein